MSKSFVSVWNDDLQLKETFKKENYYFTLYYINKIINNKLLTVQA